MTREIYVPAMQPGQVQPVNRAIYAHMGSDNIRAMLRDFYSELERSDISAMFPNDMERASQKSADFFIGLLGGPPLYHQKYGNPMMRARHMPFTIDANARAVWLACFLSVLENASEKYDFPEQYLANFQQFLSGFSMWMVNTASQNPDTEEAAES